MSLALFAVRLLRLLPHTQRFDAHLTDCAALAVVYGPFGAARLTLSHVIGISPLPDFIPGLTNARDQGVDAPVPSDNDFGSFMNPVVSGHVIKSGPQTLH